MRVLGVQLESQLSNQGGGFRVEHTMQRALAFQATDVSEIGVVRSLLDSHSDQVADHKITDATGYVSLAGEVEVSGLPEPAQLAYLAFSSRI